MAECGGNEHGAVADGPLTIDCVIGTRPEAIKMAPVVHALRRDSGFAPRVICTGQHRETIVELLPLLDLEPHLNLDLIEGSRSMSDTVGRAIAELGVYWSGNRPAAVLVQGDTGTAFGAALAAYYERIPVGHVEAGLRTFDRDQPFPEETNRVLITRVAAMHFCPTAANRENLLREGVPAGDTFVTGNTGIDCLHWFWRMGRVSTNGNGRGRLILVTAHRRENWGPAFEEICAAIAAIAAKESGVRIVFPVHPNPLLREAANRRLSGVPAVELVDPLPYDRFVSLMRDADLLVTDSGGIQEEACSVGKPTLVMRNVTERQEGVQTGSVRIIGTRADDIVSAVCELLHHDDQRAALSKPTLCFGDGAAAARIVAALRYRLLNGERPDDYQFEPPAEPNGRVDPQRRQRHRAVVRPARVGVAPRRPRSRRPH